MSTNIHIQKGLGLVCMYHAYKVYTGFIGVIQFGEGCQLVQIYILNMSVHAERC